MLAACKYSCWRSDSPFMDVAYTARRPLACTRTVFIESVGRYDRLFSVNQPSHFAQFTERVPMVKGRLDRRASTATGYCWLDAMRSTPLQARTRLPSCVAIILRTTP